MRLFFNPNDLDLSRERLARDFGIPEVPLQVPPPGFYRMDLLRWSYKGILPEGARPWDRARCMETRERHGDRFLDWARCNYTWDQFLGEVNWISDSQAMALLELLLERDILHEMRRGVLQGRTFEKTPRSRRLPEMERMLSWMRVGNRWAWWIDALRSVPDPKYFPIPRLDFDVALEGRGGGTARVLKHLRSVERALFDHALEREFVEVAAAYMLYALGFQSEPPRGLSWNTWGQLTQTLDLDLLLRWPASYLGYLLAESKVGRAAGFFPTPMSVARAMVEMAVGGERAAAEGPDDPDSVAARKKALCATFGEPAAGSGDLILAASNHLWLGGPFWDIHPTIAAAGRAQLALYAPWFAQSYCLARPPAGSLAPPDELAQQAAERQKEHLIERQRAIYALEDWTARHAGEMLAAPAQAERVVEAASQAHALSHHIRHRAEARATRHVRHAVAAMEKLLSGQHEILREPPLPGPTEIPRIDAAEQMSLFDLLTADAGRVGGSG